MAELTAEKYVERSTKLYEAAMTVNYERWHKQSLESFQFSIGIQQSDELLEKLIKKGMPTFIINKITPIKEMIKFFVTANSPTWRAVGWEESDTDIGKMHDAVGEHSWYISHGKTVFSGIIDDALGKSLGWFHVKVDANMDRGNGEVVYASENPWTVFVDPLAKDIMYRDANWMMIKDDSPRGTLLGMYPDEKYQAKIKKAEGGILFQNYFNYMGIDSRLWESSSDKNPVSEVNRESLAYNIDGEEDDILAHHKLYTKEKVKYANVFMVMPPNDVELKRITKIIQEKITEYNEELDVKAKEQIVLLDKAKEEGMHPDRYTLEIKKLAKGVEQAKQTYAEKLTSDMIKSITQEVHQVYDEAQYKVFLKQKKLQQYVTDTSFYFEDVIKLTVTIGDQWLFTKKMPSKRFPLIPIPYIFTGNTFPMSLVQLLMGKQKEINKSHQIMIHNANLGSNLRWIAHKGAIDIKQWEDYSASAGAILEVNPGQPVPKEVLPMPLSNAFLGITEKGGDDLEYLAGIFRSSMGDVAAMHDTARGAVKADEFGTRRTRQWVDNIIEPALEQVGLVFKDFAQALYQKHKIAKFYGSDFQQKSFEINVPLWNNKGEIISRYNDYASAEFDVKIVAGSTLPSNQEEKFNRMLILHKEKLVDDITVIKASPDIENKEEVIQRRSLLARQAQEIKTLQDKIKDFAGKVQSLEHVVVTSKIQVMVSDLGAKLNAEVVQSKARISKGEVEASADLQKMLDSFSLDLDKKLFEATKQIEAKVEETPPKKESKKK